MLHVLSFLFLFHILENTLFLFEVEFLQYGIFIFPLQKNNTDVRCNHNPSPSAFFFLIQSLIIRAFPNSSYAYEYRTKASSGFFSLISIQGLVKTVGKYPQKNKAIQDKHIRVACDDEL